MLFETMANAPGLFSAGGESHARIEQVADFFPGKRGWSSNRLTEQDARPEAVEQLAASFYAALKDRNGATPRGAVRMLEKTPKNALRVPFFNSAWPDALFVYLYRDVRETLGSMIEAWISGRFVTYPMLPGWGQPPWSLLLVPGWRDLTGRDLAEVVARQWTMTTEVLVDDLSRLPASRVIGLNYSTFLADPQSTMQSLSSKVGLDWDSKLAPILPLSKTTYSKPAPDKWRRFESEIVKVLPLVASAEAKALGFLGEAN